MNIKRNKKKLLYSLRFKLLLVLLAAACAAILCVYGLQSLTNYTVNTYYCSEEKMAAREQRLLHSLRKYVRENEVSAQNISRLAGWTKNHQYVYLSICDEEGYALYESGWWDDGVYEESSYSGAGESNSSYYDPTELDPVQFADGTYGVSIIEFTELRWLDLGDAFSYILATALFLAIVIFYNTRVNGRIIRLSKEVDAVSNGNLKQHITVAKNDEITALSKNVDQMRNYLILRLEEREEAWEANRELITSMSHDIRTPLTSLLGYIEILEQGQYKDEAQKKQYLEKVKEKTLHLKSLSDKLFSYFMIFGSDQLPVQLQRLEAGVCLEQMLGEQLFDLEQKGFTVQMDMQLPHGYMLVDVEMLRRIFDNVFSNIAKYGDLTFPVDVECRVQTSHLCVTVVNKINPVLDKIESSNLGNKICVKIARQLGGSIMFQNTGGLYKVVLYLPFDAAKPNQIEGEKA